MPQEAAGRIRNVVTYTFNTAPTRSCRGYKVGCNDASSKDLVYDQGLISRLWPFLVSKNVRERSFQKLSEKASKVPVAWPYRL